MQSYPNCNGFDRVLKEPDAHQLAEICEELGLDFQIVLLTRFPDSVLISTTIKRQFGPSLTHQAQFYPYVLDILLAQLGSLDPKFISGCINIETNKTEAKRLISPLKHRIGLDNQKMDQFLKHWSTRPRPCIEQAPMPNNWTLGMVDFYKKSIMIEKICENIVLQNFDENLSPL